MKNKILASLLAVCLFVGLAVPAFAALDNKGVASVKLAKTTVEVIEGIPANVNDLVKPTFYDADGKALANPDGTKYEITWTMATSKYFNFDKNPEITGEIANTSVMLTGTVNNDVAPIIVTVKTIKKVNATTFELPATATAAQGVNLVLTAKLNGNAPASEAGVVWSQDGVAATGKDNTYTFNETAVGTYTVTASIIVNGKEVKKSTKVTVAKGIAITSISLPETSKVNAKSKLELKATFLPANSNVDKTLEWASDDTTIATVDANGVVTGEKEGTCVITAILKSSKGTDKVIKAATVLTVNPKGTVVLNLQGANRPMIVGDTFKAKINNLDKMPKDTKVTFKSLDEKIVSVDKNGVIKALKAGVGKILVTVDGYADPLYFTLTVKDKPAPGKPSTGTNVPNTGDVLLTNLF